ncbi:solute carrier family 23 protein [Enterococcus rivorum]|uniref:solute carrier family 23 protein n=1 Tax=Enterococcus rivorum TaxID=762845 RepID=UPI00362BB19E
MNNETIAHPIDEKLSKGKTISLAIQHMLIAILSAIPVPLIISQHADLSKDDTTYFISAVILASGISSICAVLALKKLVREFRWLWVPAFQLSQFVSKRLTVPHPCPVVFN